MHLTLIKNEDESKIVMYKVARVIYAETLCSSLGAVEALASMIINLCTVTGQSLSDVIEDKNVFESLNTDSTHHQYLSVDVNRRGFQMCLRIVQRMMIGSLPDACYGATKFHRIELLPDWALARGYIAEIDDLLFYL